MDGISFTAHDGETLGILGPNGAGKTTLLRMLGSLMEPDGGSVCWYDSDGNLMKDPVEARRKMGYLSNNTKLSDKFTVREYLEMTGKRQTKDTDQYWLVPFSMETTGFEPAISALRTRRSPS